MRFLTLAILCASALASAQCPNWVGQATAYPVGTVMAYNGQNYQVVRTLDNGFITPSDTYFWSPSTATCEAASTGSGSSTSTEPTSTLDAISITPATAKNTITIVVTGQKQGHFKGEMFRKGMETKAQVLNLDESVSSPRDAASGLATGKRVHAPLTITKAWGNSSPQFYQALVNNENLTEVQIDLYTTSATTGAESIRATIRLTNASVAAIHHHLDASGNFVEDVSFTFQRIELSDVPGKTMATDEAGSRI